MLISQTAKPFRFVGVKLSRSTASMDNSGWESVFWEDDMYSCLNFIVYNACCIKTQLQTVICSNKNSPIISEDLCPITNGVLQVNPTSDRNGCYITNIKRIG